MWIVPIDAPGLNSKQHVERLAPWMALIEMSLPMARKSNFVPWDFPWPIRWKEDERGIYRVEMGWMILKNASMMWLPPAFFRSLVVHFGSFGQLRSSCCPRVQVRISYDKLYNVVALNCIDIACHSFVDRFCFSCYRLHGGCGRGLASAGFRLVWKHHTARGWQGVPRSHFAACTCMQDHAGIYKVYSRSGRKKWFWRYSDKYCSTIVGCNGNLWAAGHSFCRLMRF